MARTLPKLSAMPRSVSRLPPVRLRTISASAAGRGTMARLLASGRRLRKSSSAAMPPGMTSTITSSNTA